MLQLLLFVTLLLLPFNVTPYFIVWSYQKILHLSESAFLLTEAVLSVLVVMFVSQSIVNEIDEHPVLVKVKGNIGNKVCILIGQWSLYYMPMGNYTSEGQPPSSRQYISIILFKHKYFKNFIVELMLHEYPG